MKKNFSKILSIALALVLVCVMFAGCTTTGESGETTGVDYTTIIILVVLIAVFYFFMIRPENKKKKKLEEMRSNLSVGDKITTIGGMVGKIVDVSGDLITFETGEDRVRIQVTKWAISTNGVQKAENDESGK